MGLHESPEKVVASAHNNNAASSGAFVNIHPVLSSSPVHIHVVLSKEVRGKRQGARGKGRGRRAESKGQRAKGKERRAEIGRIAKPRLCEVPGTGAEAI